MVDPDYLDNNDIQSIMMWFWSCGVLNPYFLLHLFLFGDVAE